MKLKPEVKEKWVAALRSGEYKQGQGKLRPSTEEYCCLGVLCDIYSKETKTGLWNRDEFFVNDSSATDLPPKDVDKWAYINLEEDKTFLYETSKGYLPELNDDGLSFTDIADLIEQEL